MAEKPQGKNRKRKHFEMEKSRQSPFQNTKNTAQPAAVVSKAPRGINVAEFAESRALEIHNMMQALSSASKQSNKRVFQSLPRHMRRRAASHNSKRMPARLRDAYNREALKSQEKQKELSKQKKSRRHRRKHSNLLSEYSRRQRKHAWLETHIWHAKRFKMIEQWGYKIPLHPNDKSVRASYRAMANGCLLQDISYYQCIEIHSLPKKIVAAMKHLTSSDIGNFGWRGIQPPEKYKQNFDIFSKGGLTMAAKEYLDGRHEGHVMLYKYDQHPYHAIGPVMFLWQQHQQVEDTSTIPMTKLWVWSHPVCSDEVAKEIVHACSLEGSTECVKSKPWLPKENGEVTENMATSESNSSGSVSEFTVTVLHEQLVRLRLTGPKSHALLAATLELCEWSTERDNPGSQWWEMYSQGEDRIKMLEEQNKSWEQIKGVASPAVLKTGSVLALVVKDPRLGLPVRKSSVDMASEDLYKDVSSEESTLTSIFEGSAVSPLWDCAVRQEVKQTKMPEKDLNNMRSKQAVPGSKLDLGDETSRIPMLVIQQPGSTGNYQMGSINFGSGYDVILPAGWSMAFWIAFVYRGARVGGARELATCSREQGMPHFPCDFPDTKAGREYNEEQKRSGEEKYKRYPPAKRPNYVKFGMVCPFAQDWNTLVHEWNGQVERLEVEMKKMAGNEHAVQDSQESGNDKGKVIANVEEQSNKDSQSGQMKCLELSSDEEKAVGSEKAVKDSQSGQLKCLELGSDEGKVFANVEEQSEKDCQSGRIQCLKEGGDEGDVNNGGLKDDGVHSAHDPKAISNHVEACNEDQNEICEDVVGRSVLDGAEGDIAGDSERTHLDTPNLHFNVIRTLSIRRRLQDIIFSLKQTTKRRPHKNKIPDEEIVEYLTKTITMCSCSLVCLNLRPLLKGCPEDNAAIYIPTSEDLMELQKDKSYGGPVEHVHKGSNSSSMIGLCSRKAIGWVTSGQYSFARGQGSAVGFCTIPGFYELIMRSLQERCSPVVLLRNTSTFQYRFVNIIVV